jgi:hypothetical protein
LPSSLYAKVGGGEIKLRAIRVVAEAAPYDRKAPLIPNLRGTVTREPKRETPGTLALLEGLEIDGKPFVPPSPQEEMKAAYADIFSAIEEIVANPDIQELELPFILPRQRFAIHELIRTYFAGSLHSHSLSSSTFSPIYTVLPLLHLLSSTPATPLLCSSVSLSVSSISFSALLPYPRSALLLPSLLLLMSHVVISQMLALLIKLLWTQELKVDHLAKDKEFVYGK